MKVKVLMKFRDKYTKNIYPKDEVIDVTEERFSELIAGPYIFVENIEEELRTGDTGKEDTVLPIETPIDGELSKQSNDSEPPKEELPSLDSFEAESLHFESMTKPELMEYSRKLNIELNMSMTKAEMIESLKSR